MFVSPSPTAPGNPLPNSRSRTETHACQQCTPPKRPLEKMTDKVNLAQKIRALDGFWRPGIVGHVNDHKLEVVRVQGQFVWHRHDHTDDFFLVLHGRVTVQLPDRDVELNEGEMFVVPRGIPHCPKADQEAHVLLIEPRGTANTGDAGGDLTAPEVEI